MSNSARVWIGYALFALTPLVIIGAAFAGYWGEVANLPFAAVVPFAILISWTIALFGYLFWAKCGRCGTHLHLVADTLWSPIVLRAHCLRCGVRHTARPDKVRDNPIGNFRPPA
jgi:hypothetical protein